MKTYKTAKKWKIILYSFCALIGLFYGGFGIVLLLPDDITFFHSNDEPMVQHLLVALFFFMMLFMGFLILLMEKRQFIITQDSFKTITLFKTRELKFHEVKGFEAKDDPKLSFLKIIAIESDVKGKKHIIINNLYEKSEEIISFLNLKFTDIDAVKTQALQEKVEKENSEIISKYQFVISDEERNNKLEKTKKVGEFLNAFGIIVPKWVFFFPRPYFFAIILNVLGTIISVWAFFFPRPYLYVIIACICLPLIALLIVNLFKGLIKLDVEKGSVYPSAMFPIAFPGMLLFFRAMKDFSIYDYSNVWTFTIIIAIIFCGTLLIIEKDLSLKSKAGFIKVLGFIMISFAYGYGTVITTNCIFDKSEPKVFQTKIVDKKINGGKYTRYDIYLSPWGQKTEIEEVHVDKEFFNTAYSGKEVNVYQFKGKFDIPWIVVGDK